MAIDFWEEYAAREKALGRRPPINYGATSSNKGIIKEWNKEMLLKCFNEKTAAQ